MRTQEKEPIPEEKSLYDMAIEQGLEMGGHESDLYLKVTPESKELIKNYKYRPNVTTFISQIDKALWYDIPFAYQPFWEKRTR